MAPVLCGPADVVDIVGNCSGFPTGFNSHQDTLDDSCIRTALTPHAFGHIVVKLLVVKQLNQSSVCDHSTW